MDIGPQTYDGPECIYPPCYEYAVVTDNLQGFLFVLARNVADFNANFDAALLEKLKDQGFTQAINKPIRTYQNSDCVYVPAP